MDEGRFGRIRKPTDCWAPEPIGPKVPRQIVRESVYAFAAVAPERGERVHRLYPKCNTAALPLFLLDPLDAWPDVPLLLILDGAGWHKARFLAVPERLRLWHLPPNCPKCNPRQQIWDATRQRALPNPLFATLADVEVRLKTQLEELCADSNRLPSLTLFSLGSPPGYYNFEI